MGSPLSRSVEAVNPLLHDPSASVTSQRASEPHTVTFGGGPDAYLGPHHAPGINFNGSLTIYLKAEQSSIEQFYQNKQKTWKIINLSALVTGTIALIPAVGTYNIYDLSKLVTGVVVGGAFVLLFTKLSGLQDAPKPQNIVGEGEVVV